MTTASRSKRQGRAQSKTFQDMAITAMIQLVMLKQDQRQQRQETATRGVAGKRLRRSVLLLSMALCRSRQTPAMRHLNGHGYVDIE